MADLPSCVPFRWRSMSLLEVIFLCKNVDFKPMTDADRDCWNGAEDNTLIAYAQNIIGDEFVLLLSLNELYIQPVLDGEGNYVTFRLADENNKIIKREI